MKYFLPLVLLAGATSCKTLANYKVPQTYVQADRATFEVIEPVMRALADTDPSNDPDLSGANGAAVLTMLDTWEARIDNAELTFEAAD